MPPKEWEGETQATRSGLVVEAYDGDRVKVLILEESSSCVTCGRGEGCCMKGDRASCGGIREMFSFIRRNPGYRQVEARNLAQAQVGQWCRLKLRQKADLVKGSFTLYIIPGLLFILGLILGGWLGGWLGLSDDPKVLAQLGGGTLFLALGLGIANLYGRVRREAFTPIVTEVVDADPTALKLEVRVVGDGRTD